MRRETLRESREQLLQLTEAQARALQAVGRRLRSTKSWWGEEEADESRSAISCRPAAAPGNWYVNVLNAVGLISIEDVHIAVLPKIPQTHLLYLFGRSGEFPRLEEDRASGEVGPDLWELVAHWFVGATERLLRSDLVRDYELTTEVLPVLRGHFDLLGATLQVYQGQLRFECEFDEFSADTPLNRALKAAARSVAASTVLGPALRRRALRLQSGMEEVGELRHGDVNAILDRRTHAYQTPLSLAKHVLQGQGRLIEHGAAATWTFLIPTPLLVEQGLRAVLAEGLSPQWSVQKRGLQLEGSTITFNPDLVIERGTAVGDVKYKLFGREWNRPDLYQVLAFAEAYHSKHCALVGFRTPDRPSLGLLKVGDTEVHELCWPSDPSMTASVAASALVETAVQWLRAIASTESRVTASL